jgi:hypothetical protein
VIQRSSEPIHPPDQGKPQGGSDHAILDLEAPPLTCVDPVIQVDPPTGGGPWIASPPGDAEPADHLAPSEPTRATPLADLVADVRARRAEQRAVRAELDRRRQYGLARRHAAKLAHWREHGLPPNLAELAAKIDARTSMGPPDPPGSMGADQTDCTTTPEGTDQ